ncbi:MAG: hypothetical protein OHK0022_51950 [Roseiflexaceae bacterium]
MLGILEILLFICGLWALITGKLPAIVFGKKYRIEGNGARIIGAILVAPLPLAIGAGVILGILMGEDGVMAATIIEIVLVLISFVVAAIISRKVRQPVPDTVMGT